MPNFFLYIRIVHACFTQFKIIQRPIFDPEVISKKCIFNILNFFNKKKIETFTYRDPTKLT